MNILDFQCAVNRELIARKEPPHGEHGGLLSDLEMDALDEAYEEGASPEGFALTLINARQSHAERAFERSLR